MTGLRDVSEGVPDPVGPDNAFTRLVDEKAGASWPPGRASTLRNCSPELDPLGLGPSLLHDGELVGFFGLGVLRAVGPRVAPQVDMPGHQRPWSGRRAPTEALVLGERTAIGSPAGTPDG